MDRYAFLTRTRLADNQDHGNHLRVPKIGILSLSVSVGNSASKSHPPQQQDQGTDDFHFVPEKETAKISYEIDDPFAIVDTARLEIFSRFNANALWTLDLTKLGEDWYAHGKHEVKWDGRIANAEKQAANRDQNPLQHDLAALQVDKSIPDFPDGYLTLEHTPYKVKLTIASEEIKDFSAMAWTYVQILIKSIEIEIAPEECVPNLIMNAHRTEMSKALRKTLSVPQAHETKQVILPSNIFKKKGGDMYDETAFLQYQALLGDGLYIPLLAKIRLADSTGAEVKLEDGQGAVALGKVRFLWDWQDPDEDVNKNQGAPKTFISAAIDYDKQTTEPKGDNCHAARGGKRGPNATPVFPACIGYPPQDLLKVGEFPFKVEACRQRKWAAYSYGWTKGKLKGQTGVLFQPSRMAGDDYVITVYLAYDKTGPNDFALDKKDQPLEAAQALKKSTGKFQIWREVHIVRYIRKRSSIDDFLQAKLADAQTHYRKTYLELKDARERDNTYSISAHKLANNQLANYDQICEEALLSTNNFVFTQYLAAETITKMNANANENHASDPSMFVFLKYMQFVWRLHSKLNNMSRAEVVKDFAAVARKVGGNATAAEVSKLLGVQNDLTAWADDINIINRLAATKTWLVNNGVATEIAYAKYLNDHAPCQEVVTGLQTLSGGKTGPAKDGITVMQFDYIHNLQRELINAGNNISYTDGIAMEVTDRTRNRCVLALFQPSLTAFVHEIGHHLFLPHAKGGNPPADGIEEKFHDDADLKCFMSYDSLPGAFCGLCQLRLRGWDANRLNKIGANNRKA